jgi:hypothetical protein
MRHLLISMVRSRNEGSNSGALYYMPHKSLAVVSCPEVLELYRERTNSTMPEIETSFAVRSRYNDLKVAAPASLILKVCILNCVDVQNR